MSLFAPMDPRGPDQRRKQLMAKLAQQHRGAAPMPTAAGGMSFRGTSNFRPPATHGGNVVASILQRLGVGGGPGQGEFSPGEGMPIGHTGAGDPFSRTPTPITGGTPIPHGDPPPVPPPGVTPTPAAPPLGDSPYPPTPTPSPVPPAGMTGSDATTEQTPGLIPLGNGLFYDPSTDRVTGGGAPVDRSGGFGSSATGARSLYRG